MDVEVETHSCPLTVLIDCWVRQSICLYLFTNQDPKNRQSNRQREHRRRWAKMEIQKLGRWVDNTVTNCNVPFSHVSLAAKRSCCCRSDKAARLTNPWLKATVMTAINTDKGMQKIVEFTTAVWYEMKWYLKHTQIQTACDTSQTSKYWFNFHNAKSYLISLVWTSV